jgi:hypothetical protein
VVFALWVAVEPPADPEAIAAIPDALAGVPTVAAALWLVARVLGSVVVVPVAEELAFRGYLLRRLIDVDFTAVSPKHFTADSSSSRRLSLAYHCLEASVMARPDRPASTAPRSFW